MIPLIEISNEEYHADTSRISKSGLDVIARSPAHYCHKYLGAGRRTENNSPALVTGSAVHSAILEPEKFGLEYVRGIECDRRTTEGKKLWNDWLPTSGGKIILAGDTFDMVQNMRESVFAHPSAAKLLAGGRPEGVIHFTHTETDVLCKARLDLLHSSERFIVDIKTTEDASPAAFAKSIANYRYHVQGAFYLDAFAYAGYTPPEKFVFIAVEKSPPYAVACYYLDAEAIEVGRDIYAENLRTYAAAKASGDWFGYSPKIKPIKLPLWALNQ